MRQRIPPLNCTWSDVLHLAAVHPKEIDTTIERYGRNLRFRKFIKIDPEELAPEDTTVFLCRDGVVGPNTPSNEWAPYNPGEVGKYSVLPKETGEYYREEIESGRAPLLWYKVPHILYRGSLDIKNCEIVEL
jgi:hypothetical protein